jgi:hypothetical protein
MQYGGPAGQRQVHFDFFIPVSFNLINPENTIEAALKSLVKQGRLKSGATAVIVGSILVGEQIVDAVQMRVV